MQQLLAQINPAGLVPPSGGGVPQFGGAALVPPSNNIQSVPEPSFLLGFIFLALISLLIKKKRKKSILNS